MTHDPFHFLFDNEKIATQVHSMVVLVCLHFLCGRETNVNQLLNVTWPFLFPFKQKCMDFGLDLFDQWLSKVSWIIFHVSNSEVNISSYPARILAGLFFFCRAEILNSGGFVQKYSDQGVSCKNIGQWQPPGTVMCYPVMRRDYLDLTKPNQ